MTRTLLLIFAALALMIGSFVWFVVTWDRDAEQPVTYHRPAPASSDQTKLPPEGQLASPADLAVKTQPLAVENVPNSDISLQNQLVGIFTSDSPDFDPYQTHTGPIPNPYGVL